jgi:hypothetical protein
MVSWLTHSNIMSDTWVWKVQSLSLGNEMSSRIKLVSEKYAVSISMTIQELLIATGEELSDT